MAVGLGFLRFLRLPLGGLRFPLRGGGDFGFFWDCMKNTTSKTAAAPAAAIIIMELSSSMQLVWPASGWYSPSVS